MMAAPPGLWVGVRGVSVCVARVVFLREALRGSGFGGGSSIATSFHAGGGVPVIDGSCCSVLVLPDGGPGRGPLAGR